MQKSMDDYVYVFKIEEVTNKQFRVDGLKITTKELNHLNNLAYRIECDDKVFIYTGDTDYCDEQIGRASCRERV